jgi:hypothetical protein
MEPVGRIYAGILGPLAFLTTTARGVLHGNPVEAVVWNAWWGLLLLSAAGCVIGLLADRIVEESVSGRVAAELEAQRALEAAAAGAAIAEDDRRR